MSSPAMAKSPQDNFIRCHAALHDLLSSTIPSLQYALDAWHQRTTGTFPPCSNPGQCPSYKKPSAKNNSCAECIAWAAAIEAQVYPPSSVGSLQWMNSNSTLFCKDPLEVIKLFVLRMPSNQKNAYSSLGDFDTASLLMMMGKFKDFHHGDKTVFDMIQKVAQIRNALAHLKHSKSLHLDEQTFRNYWADITNLVNSLPGLGHPYFTPQTANDVITKLKDIKDKSIPVSIQKEALKPLIEDIVLKTIHDLKPDQTDIATEPQELSTEPDTWQKQLKALYKSKRSGIGFLPGSSQKFHSDEFFVDLELVQEQKTPMKVKKDKLNTYEDLLSLRDGKGRTTLNYILLSGLGGTGKTTIMSRFAYQWASTDVTKHRKLASIEHVFLIDLREIEANMDILGAIRGQLLGNISRNRLEEYLVENTDKCLYLFDGYDELSPSNLLLNSSLLCGSNVIVTTRPNKVDRFYENHNDNMYVQVEVQGFSEEGCAKFIKSFFQDEGDDERKKIVSDIFSNDMIRNVMHFPLLLGMICSIWKDLSVLTPTVTKLYDMFVDNLLKHWKARDARFDSMSFEQFKDHIGFDRNMLKLGETALNGLLDSRLIFKENEFDSSGLIEHGCALGILSSEIKTCGVDKITYISFIHKTFQEYCAALYLSSLADANVESMKKYLAGMDVYDMEYVIRFSCGTSKTAAEIIMAHIVETRDETDRKDSCRLPLILLFESESSHGVQSALHTLLRPAIENITMFVSRGYDPDYLSALSYIDDNFEKQTWTTHVKMVTIPKSYFQECGHRLSCKFGLCKTCDLNVRQSTGAMQLNILNKLPNVKELRLDHCGTKMYDKFSSALAKHLKGLIGSVGQVTLNGEVDVNTVYALLCQTSLLIKFHIDCVVIVRESYPQVCASVFQNYLSGSRIRSMKVSGFDMSQSTPIFEGMIEAGNHSLQSSGNCENRTNPMASSTAGQAVSLPLEELRFEKMRLDSESYLSQSRPLYYSYYLPNAVSKLCAATVFLGNLKTLDLHDCKLVYESFLKLGPKLSNLTKLQTLDLSCNIIGRSLEAVIEGINHSNLKNLDLHCTSLTAQSKIAFSLMQLMSLESLNLSDNSIDPRDGKALAMLLKHTPKLTILNLSGNDLGFEGLMDLSESFKYIKHLSDLDLDKNRIGPSGAKILASAMQNTTGLQILSLSNNQIQCDGAQAIAAALTHTKNILFLDLSGNQIQADGAMALAAVLQHTPLLEVTGLDLSHNQIRPESAKALASALQYNRPTPLRKLNWSHNQIQCDGAIALADAFRCTPFLTVCDLSYNQIKCDGAKAIALVVLQYIPELYHLGLSGNQIQCEGAKYLGVAIKHSTELRSLDVTHNQIKSDGITFLKFMVSRLPHNFILRFDQNVLNRVLPRTSLGDRLGFTSTRCQFNYESDGSIISTELGDS